MSVTIGIDVGGTKIAAGVVDEAGAVVARRQIATAATHPTAVVAGIVKVAQELLAAAPNVSAVGIGAAGLIDGEKGIVLTAPNIAGWDNVPLRAMVSDRLKLPVIIDNDANVAALGESEYGAGKDYGDQIMLTIGTGVGGEIGHMIVDGTGSAVCACGNHGCLEAMASGNSIGRRARERASEPGATAVLELAGQKAVDITGELVGEAARSGDPWARDIIAETGRWLGVGIASLVNIFDPEVVIIAGGAATGTGDLLLGPARDNAAGLIIGHAWRALPPVVLATLGYDAGLVGAASLARGIT